MLWGLSAILVTSPLLAESRQPLRVLGSATIRATTLPGHAGPRVEGRLADDGDRPVSGARIDVDLTRVGAALPPRNIIPCPSYPAPPATSDDELAVATDAEGRFCFELPDTPGSGSIGLGYTDPEHLLGSASLSVAATPERQAIELRFVQAPHVLSLNTPTHAVEVSTRLRFPGPSRESLVEAELIVELGLEAPHRELVPLATSRTHVGERARFELSSDALGAPGAALLVARIKRPEGLAGEEARKRITKTAFVELSPVGDRHAGDAQDGIEVEVLARTVTGEVDGGSVEARLDGNPISTASVANGRARLLVRLPGRTPSGSTPEPVSIELVYVSSAPWWLPGPPAHTVVELRPASVWRQLPWFVAAAGILAWIAVLWTRPAERKRARSAEPPRPPGREELAVDESDARGYAGTVRDAHTGEALSGAELTILAPGLEGEVVLEQVTTDRSGAFTADWTRDTPDATRLRVAAAGYSTLDRPLPARGTLTVHLVARRRALLTRLIAWAERRGKPWYTGRPPTPRQVALTADLRGEELTADWARSVEEAVYGPSDPKEETERQLEGREPR